MPDDWRTADPDGDAAEQRRQAARFYDQKLKFETNSKKRYNVENELNPQGCIKEELTEFESEVIESLRKASLCKAEQACYINRMGGLIGEIRAAIDQQEIPKTAPELWRNRTDLDELPHEFVLRVYGEFMGEGGQFSRADLRRLDDALRQALHKQQADPENKIPDDFHLPTKKELGDRELQRVLETGKIPENRVDYARLQGLAQRRGVSLFGKEKG